VAEQRLHSALAPIDVLTRIELEETLHKEMGARDRQRYLGLDLVRFPRITILAVAATVNVGAVGNDEVPCGPSSGDFWQLRRVIVVSNAFGDTAKYILFRGSAPSDAANAYGPLNLLEGFTAAGAGQPVGVGYYPATKSVFLQPGEQIYAQVLGATVGNVYVMSGEAIRVPAEMKGKILA
jgi:hypothetical protein